MAVKVSQQRDQGVMTDNVKLISMILLSVSLFFSVLFFTSFQILKSSTQIGVESDDSYFFVFLVTMTALTLSVIAMEFYHPRHRALAMLKYATIVGNAVFIGFVIHELSKGYAVLLTEDDNLGQDATVYTYAALATGFAGIGTLLAVLHNFHGIVGAV